MFVSRVRPRAVDPSVVFSAPLAKIVELLKQNSGGMHLHTLVESIAPSPPKDDDAPLPVEGEAPKLTQQQMEALKDIRWLATEGYVIEYSDGMIFLGVQGEPAPVKKADEAPKAEKTEKPAKARKAPKIIVPIVDVLEDVFE
jgi:hypothetical protein